MSWDLVLFNSKKTLSSMDDVEEDFLEDIDFDSLLSKYFQVQISENGHCEINDEGFTIEYFKDEEMVSNKILSLYGENGIYEIANFAKKFHFQIYDTGLEKMIDLDNPQNNGFEKHKEFVKGILRQ